MQSVYRLACKMIYVKHDRKNMELSSAEVTDIIDNPIRSPTLTEKARLCGGKDYWHLHGVERLNLFSVMVDQRITSDACWHRPA